MNIKNHKTTFGAGLAALAFSTMLTSTAQSQTCTAVPTCEELGYNKAESDCATTPLKCPFDKTKCHCLTAEELSATTPPVSNCEIGDILYSDKSCNANFIVSKTPIGVVFDPTNRLAAALKTEKKAWSTSYFDIPDLPNIESQTAVTGDWQGKKNTAIILSYCKANSKNCPAAEYVNSYVTAGTKAGDWYLPAGGELQAIYNNRAVLNGVLNKIGGTAFPDRDSWHWTSSEVSDESAWEHFFDFDAFGCGYDLEKHNTFYVRPVLAF